MSVKRRTLIYVMVIMICLMGLSARAAMETEHSSRTQEASAAGGFTEGGITELKGSSDQENQDVWGSMDPGAPDQGDGGLGENPAEDTGTPSEDPWNQEEQDPAVEAGSETGPDNGHPAPSGVEAPSGTDPSEEEWLDAEGPGGPDLQDGSDEQTEEEENDDDAYVMKEDLILAGPVELNQEPDALFDESEDTDPEEVSAVEGRQQESVEDPGGADETETEEKPDQSEEFLQMRTAPGESDSRENIFDETEKDSGSGEFPGKETGIWQDEKDEEEYRYEDSMSLRELALLPREEAGAATELEERYGNRRKGAVILGAASQGCGLWSCSDYYVNEQDLHTVQRKEDFSLKYQIEFHTSTDLDERSVEIRVPRALLEDRFGEDVVPSQIGVPGGSADAPVQSLNSPFNWYLDDTDQSIVFFNYRAISAGTNTAFQVLYHPVRIMELTDASQWSITPSIRVTLQSGDVQTAVMEELKGSIDSGARILSASADAFSDGSISCMPALYTRDQVRRVLGSSLPSGLYDEEGQWLFIAWQTDCLGEYNQPWALQMDAAPSATGIKGDDSSRVVGGITRITGSTEGTGGTGSIVKQYITPEGSQTFMQLSSDDLSAYVEQGLFHLSTVVVTAVRKDSLKNNESVLGLDASFRLTPADGVDAESLVQASASWTFSEYQWKYKGDDVGIFAWSGLISPDGSISYKTKNVSLSGWVNEYRISQSTGDPAGSIPVRILSECRGYSFTHETSGPEAGKWKPGTGYEVTTTDDAAYLACLSRETGSGMQLLTAQDYYYSDVTVSIRDRGIDIFEDRVGSPMPEEECPGADRSTRIWVMYENSADWELAAQCPWNASGRITYTFPRSQLARKIWRVKVVHNAVDYDSSCTIDAKLCIRPDSPVCGALLEGISDDSITLLKAEHLGSVLARSTGGSEDVWFHDSDESHYDDAEPGIRELTMSLYGMYSMRANSSAELTALKKHAKAMKTVSRENDPESGCIRLTCTIGAVEGYRIYSQEAAKRIRQDRTGFPSPDRSEYVIFDLLPEGVVYDPTVPLRAGLVMEASDKNLVTPSLWSSRDVSVRIDPESGIVENWKQTGRTMVIFHVTIHLEEESIPRMNDGMWLNGVGVEFGASCPYRDLKLMKRMPNIAAVMPGSGRDDPARQILGTDEEVSCDDGIIVPYTGEEKDELEVFGTDIDSDGVTDLRTVLYAIARSEADTAVSLTDGIRLTVKDDRDVFSDWDVSAVTGPEDAYTYRIDVTNTSAQPIFNLVIANHLERAQEERALAESGRVFDDETWRGFLAQVDTDAVRRAGIEPVVWLSTDRTAPLPGEGSPPDSVLTTQNGWVRLEDWTLEMSDVGSVAVDLRKKTDGSSFQLEMGESVHILLHMTAPEIGDEEGQTRAERAYNCASFYSTSQDEPDGDLVQCDAVEVTLKENAVLIVEKELENEPENVRGKPAFLFRLTRNGRPYPLCEYRLEERSGEDAETVWTQDQNLHTTARDGTFSLSEGQRAVFENEAGGNELAAEEIRSAWYEVSMSQESVEGGRLCRFDNTWYPVLFLTKKILGLPEGTDISGDEFRVMVKADGESMAGMPYWTVERNGALIDDQVLEEHTVDEDSCVLLHPGEVIALHPGDAQCTYMVAEDDACISQGSDYIGVTSAKSGILGPEGSYVTLENAWRWKELVLRKEVLHRDTQLCTEDFSFRLWKMHDGAEASSFNPEDPYACADPAAGIEGVMEDTDFRTDEDGCFTLACAGKDVVLGGLEAQKTYVIQETDVPQFYEPVNGGIACVVMPLLSGRKSVTVQNSWKKRSLEVSKAVLGGEGGSRTTVFSPGYPGEVRSEGSTVLLFESAPAGMTGFTITFPVKVTLQRNERIRVRSGGSDIDSFTGTIAAGTSRTYSGYSSVSIYLWGMWEKHKSGFFFFFSPERGGSADPGGNVSGKTFSFLLEKEDENGTLCPCPDTPYEISGGQELTTDAGGFFTLTAGESAVFRDLAEDGCDWRVTETPDPSCPQAYPAGGNPWRGSLGENGEDTSRALFVNGLGCQGMLRKRYTAAPGDAEAQRYLEQERAKGISSALRTLFYVETENGNGIYTPLAGEVLVADTAQGELLRCEMFNGWICLSETQTLVISGIPEGGSWRATETAESISHGDGFLYGTVCTFPGEGRQVTESVSGGVSDAVFVNEIHSAPVSPESLICKEYLSGEEGWSHVPEGAVLVLCLERYENGSWNPASGVYWAQCLNGRPMQSAMNQTGEDGILRVAREASGAQSPLFPIAVFGESVKTELYYLEQEAQDKDVRVREVPDLSDPSFGMLCGCENNTFYNENDLQTFVIEKQTDIESTQSFPMRITQWFGDTSLPGRYLPYQIRDSATMEVTGSGRTDAQGAFSLTGGSQAVFELPSGTKWEVTEKSSGNWTLASCTMEHSLTNHQSTSRGMRFEAAPVRHNVTLTSDLLSSQLKDPVTGQTLDFTSLDIRIPHYVKNGDEILEITKIDDSLFFAYPFRSVIIEDGIRRIGTEAFAFCEDMCSIHLPGTLEEIGDGAFSLTGITTLEIPASVKSAGPGMTDACFSLNLITIHQKREESPFSSYQWNTGTDTTVVFTE